MIHFFKYIEKSLMLAYISLIYKPPLMNLFRNSSLSLQYQKESSPSLPLLPSLPSSQIFVLPEILNIIFSFLDDYTIRHTIVYVCRQWHQLAQSRVPREVRWDWRWRRERLGSALSRLSGAGRFTCTCMALFGEYDEALYKIMNAISKQANIYSTFLDNQDKHFKNQSKGWRQLWQNDDPSLRNINPLREVELFSFRFPGEGITSNFFHFPATLTSLKFTGGVYAGTIFRIDQILTDCPLLQVFHAGLGGSILVHGPWVPINHDQKRPLKLKSLVLHNAKLEQGRLEDLLGVTPLLQELKLLGLMAVNPRISEDLVRSAYDWDRLYHCLAKLSLPLRKLQVIFNPDSILTPVQPRQRMLELLPSNISEWSFSPADNIPKLLKELSAVHSSITTLELCIPQTWSTDSACKLGRFAKGMKLLHDYLCDSPNLVKLKCIRGAILLDEIDLFDRALYTNLNHDQSDNQISRIRQLAETRTWKKKRVWTCKNLRALVIEVHAHGQECLIWPVQSRILFGYISIVCPKLEEIDLRLPSQCLRSDNSLPYWPKLYIQLQGGLCLLTRMERLRILRIERGPNGVPLNNENLQRFDISWIYSPKKHSAKRRNAIDQWKQELESERLLESTLSVLDDKGRKGHDAGMSETLGQVRYGELETSLQTLGLLSNVKAILESMDLSDFRGFPALEKLSFGGAFEQNPADEIERVFPLWYDSR